MDIKYQLKDKKGNNLFPITTTDCVVTESGLSLKEKYATKQYADEAAADILNSSPEQLQVINILGEKLADDENVANAVTKTVADSKKALFIDLWNRYCIVEGVKYGEYNEKDDTFYLNNVPHTYEEAIFNYNRCACLYMGGDLTNRFRQQRGIKTFVLPFGSCIKNSMAAMCYINPDLEVVVITTNYTTPSDMTNCFAGCTKLRQIKGEIQSVYLSQNTIIQAFGSCQNLEEVNVKFTIPWNFKDSPKLLLETLKFGVEHKTDNIDVNIKVHAFVYAKLNGVKEFFNNSEFYYNGLTCNECYGFGLNNFTPKKFNRDENVNNFTNEDIGNLVIVRLVGSDIGVKFWAIASITDIQEDYIELTPIGSSRDVSFTIPDNISEWQELNNIALEKQITFSV